MNKTTQRKENMSTNEIQAPGVLQRVSSSRGPSWCTKLFEYVKNRNRVSPGRFESGDCEFFVVGRGRTLRVMIPKSRGRGTYARTKDERPDSMDENFVSRWASRPHPSGNCRCSFRRSFNKKLDASDTDGTDESQRVVAATEVDAKATIDDRRDDSVNLRLESSTGETVNGKNHESGGLRERIVKDLEEYIDKLLGQVLTDTIRLLEDSDDNTKRPETTIEDRGFLNRGFVVSGDDEDALAVPENSNDGNMKLDNFDGITSDGSRTEKSNASRCESTGRSAFAKFARKLLFLDRRNDPGIDEVARKDENSGPDSRVNMNLEDVGEIDESRTIYRKPTLIFLHGFGSSAEAFDNQLEYFSNLGYPCVAPELLGHGMSSAPGRPRDYRFDKLLKDLEIVLEHYAFQPGRKCVLVAHNYGCSFATALARRYKSNVHQLVLISGGGPTPLAPPSTEGPGHCCLRAILAPFLMCGLGRDVLYSARGRQHPYCSNEEKSVPRPSHMRHVLNGMIWPEGDYVFHRGITAPTLLIHGLRDDEVSLVQECQMERTMIKAFLDAIPTAGHTPMVDCPEQVNHMIHCFVDLWKRKKR